MEAISIKVTIDNANDFVGNLCQAMTGFTKSRGVIVGIKDDKFLIKTDDGKNITKPVGCPVDVLTIFTEKQESEKAVTLKRKVTEMSDAERDAIKREKANEYLGFWFDVVDDNTGEIKTLKCTTFNVERRSGITTIYLDDAGEIVRVSERKLGESIRFADGIERDTDILEKWLENNKEKTPQERFDELTQQIQDMLEKVEKLQKERDELALANDL
jgi:hypothetical protein